MRYDEGLWVKTLDGGSYKVDNDLLRVNYDGDIWGYVDTEIAPQSEWWLDLEA